MKTNFFSGVRRLAASIAFVCAAMTAGAANLESAVPRILPVKFCGAQKGCLGSFSATLNGVNSGIGSPPAGCDGTSFWFTPTNTAYLEVWGWGDGYLDTANGNAFVDGYIVIVGDCNVGEEWWGAGTDFHYHNNLMDPDWVYGPRFTFPLPNQDGVYQWNISGDWLLPPRVAASVSPAQYPALVPPLTWSIVEQGNAALGCYMISNVLVSGGKAGTIHVRMTDSIGCAWVEPVELIKCEAGNCGGGKSASGFAPPIPCNGGGGFITMNSTIASIVPSPGNPDAIIQVRAPLGQYDPYIDGGYLTWQIVPGGGIKDGVSYDYTRRLVQVVPTPDLGIAQLSARETFLNTVSNAAKKFTYQFYHRTNVSNAVGENGMYSVSNSPHSSISLEQPGSDTNEIRVGRSIEGSLVETVDYKFLTNGLSMGTGGGARNEIRTTDWFETNTVRVTTHTISNAAAAIQFRRTEKYRRFGWGEGLVEQIDGTGAAARTNTFSYTSKGLIQTTTNGDGSWEHFIYDDSNRILKKLSGWLNQGFTTNESLCRVVEYDYSTNVVNAGSNSGDTGIYDPGAPRRTIEKILGTEVSRSYTVLLAGERRDIQCVVTGAVWNASDNLVTTNTFYTSGFYSGFPKTIAQPDGTITSYIYGMDATLTTNVVLRGHPDSSGTNIDDGTRTVSIHGSTGRLQEERTYAVQPGVANILVASAVHQYDGMNRVTNTTYLDGTTTTATYDCCNVSSAKDRDGSITSYAYDSLHRLLTTTRAGIITSNVYDSVGNISQVYRIGTNSGTILQTVNEYDTAGKLMRVWDALNHYRDFEETNDANGQVFKVNFISTNSSLGIYRVETYYRDGQLKSTTGDAVHGVGYEYGTALGGTFTKEIKLASDGTATSEVTTNLFDAAGRLCKTAYADGAFSQTFYNSKGQTTNHVDPDGVSVLTIYNPQGQSAFTVTDMNRDGVIDWGGTDRITWTTNYFVNNGLADVQRTETRMWAANSTNVATLVFVAEAAVNGLTNWSASFGLTNRTETSYPGSGIRYGKSIAPDGTFTTTRFENGRVISTTRTNGSTQLSGTTFGYDEHGRQKFITDARNGTTTNTFDALDRVTSRATPTPGNGQSSQQTSYSLDNLGRVIAVTHPDGAVAYFDFLGTGEGTKTVGAREYPIENTFDYAGRIKTMKTWQNYAGSGGTAITSWTNDAQRGWLWKKRYADNTGVDYAYTPAGRLRLRTWARGNTTTYTTNAAGEVEKITYSDANTGNVTNSLDRVGRVTAINQGANATTRLYSESGLLLSETVNGIVVSNRYDEFLRRTNVAVIVGGSVVSSTGYSYDSAGRLAKVLDGINSAKYSYVANSSLIDEVQFKSSSTTRMTTTKSYDFLNRLLGITNLPSADPAVRFNYAYNPANQRTAITNADSSRWAYSYDSLGQVTSGKKYWSDGSLVLGQQNDYTFDDIGNRKTAVSGGDVYGRNKRTQNYTANNLNQYTQRTVPGYLDILGTATNTATVTVNNQATSRKGDYYRAELSVPNSSAAVWQAVSNVAVLASGTNDYVTNWNGSVFLPKTTETFGYDADGNQTNDGRWTLTWDGENRLIQMQSLSGAPVGSSNRLTFIYDQQGRRIAKVTESFVSGAWSITLSNWFVYDGWNLLAELNATNNAVINSFMWGLDLSGSLQGAGGVGGLLAISTTNGGTHFVGYDGNGNIAVLVSATSGTATANYEYDPFGNVLRATGPMALLNPLRFSTKYTDGESRFNYYGFRTYNPTAGRWISRDPIAENGGAHLYGYVQNCTVNFIDVFGLGLWRISEKEIDLEDPRIPPEASITDPHGFEVQYIPKKGECPGGKIILVQAISSTGFTMSDPHIDTSRANNARNQSTKGGIDIPAMVPQGSTDHSYIDSPSGAGTTDWRMTAVALCVTPCQPDKVLGSYYFEFGNKNRRIHDRRPDRMDHFDAAVKRWKKEGGK